VQTLSWRDPELARQRRDNRAAALARLAEHLAALRARGFADVGDPEATAAALLALLDGLFRDAVLDGVGPDAARIAAAADVIDRAVFPDPTRNVVA
jgi:AcrR family transcriptional regulator